MHVEIICFIWGWFLEILDESAWIRRRVKLSYIRHHVHEYAMEQRLGFAVPKYLIENQLK